ncbi:hypothetical protein BDZ45DRAFT_782455 [Acephala macrosclerotiorum]|nr:hypothetical protein BDZ45DRAFT_782455 [Acephala macrosclerotiorum]
MWSHVSADRVRPSHFRPRFIHHQLIEVYASGNPAYAQSIAYLYEQIRETISKAPQSKAGLLGGLSLGEISKKSASFHWTPFARACFPFTKKDNSLREVLELSVPNEEALQGYSFPLLAVRSTSLCGAPVPESSLKRKLERAAQRRKVHLPAPADVLRPIILSQHSGDVAIEDLTPGTKVLARLPGDYGILSDEDVTASIDDGNHCWIYEFNDAEPFFTPGHIFITKAGVKSIKPEIAREENPGIQVHQLNVGDVLLKISGDGSVYREFLLKSFSTKHITGSDMFGLHFRKGDKGACTYHANGFLVVANYPEITINRLKEGMTILSPKEHRRFAALLQTRSLNYPSLKTIFGFGLIKSLE